MDRYHVALFVHILTLVVAVYAAAVTKLAVGRRGKARTVGEAIDWHGVLMSTSRLFPICLAAFTITGAYMLSFAQKSVWSTGFVVAGLTGVALLMVSGAYLGAKGKALQQVLEEIARRGLDQAPPTLAPPPVVAALPIMNTALAIAVVFDMVAKPESVALALMVLVLGLLLGVTAHLRGPAASGSVAPASVQPDSPQT